MNCIIAIQFLNKVRKEFNVWRKPELYTRAWCKGNNSIVLMAGDTQFTRTSNYCRIALAVLWATTAMISILNLCIVLISGDMILSRMHATHIRDKIINKNCQLASARTRWLWLPVAHRTRVILTQDVCTLSVLAFLLALYLKQTIEIYEIYLHIYNSDLAHMNIGHGDIVFEWYEITQIILSDASKDIHDDVNFIAKQSHSSFSNVTWRLFVSLSIYS